VKKPKNLIKIDHRLILTLNQGSSMKINKRKIS
jgi:hypothetical protein